MKPEKIDLKSNQKKYLRGLAHKLKPVIQIGQNGISDTVIKAIVEALNHHELIKVKFIEDKAKELKQQMATQLMDECTGTHLAGMIGHTAIFYKESDDPDKRKIILPP